ncbi:MAG: phage minor tail protein L [Moraxella sp.]|nr:phage minor tail protein L [Moraxella sp.]
MTTLNQDFQKLAVDGVITLYELDYSHLMNSPTGTHVYRFHGHNVHSNDGKIIWQGKDYTAIAIQHDGLEMRSDGRASTPTLTLANHLGGVAGAVGQLCDELEGFIGSRLSVITTLAKYLDSANFATPNPTAHDEYKKQLWYIEQKTSQDKHTVVFELANPVDFGNAKIPCREITSYCAWCVNGGYRGESCGYIGTQYFLADGTPTDNPALDSCGGWLSDCRKRGNEGSFGGFPSSLLR